MRSARTMETDWMWRVFTRFASTRVNSRWHHLLSSSTRPTPTTNTRGGTDRVAKVAADFFGDARAPVFIDGLANPRDMRRRQLGERELLEPRIGLREGHDRTVARHDPDQTVRLSNAQSVQRYRRVRTDLFDACCDAPCPDLRRDRGSTAHAEQDLAVHFDRHRVDFGVDSRSWELVLLCVQATTDVTRQPHADRAPTRRRDPSVGSASVPCAFEIVVTLGVPSHARRYFFTGGG